jgi:site-specific recombinase XerD
MHTFRSHNPNKCKFTSRADRRCKCPIWVVGRDRNGLFVRKPLHKFLRQPTFIRDWTRAQEDLRRYELGETDTTQKPTIADWRDKFLNDAEARNLGQETIRKYKLLFSQLEQFAAVKGIVRTDRIQLDDLTEFRATWRDQALSSKLKLARLRTVYDFAVKRKWVEHNLAKDIELPRVRDNPTLPFTDDEMTRILTAAKKSRRYRHREVYAFIVLMRYSGLRISDATVLAKESVSGRRIKLYTAKTGAHVSMLLPQFVVDALSLVKSKNPKYFFWSGESTKETATSTWRKHLANTFKHAGVGHGHSHRFRDTFAVSLLASGVSMQHVATLLGNSVRIAQKHYAPWETKQQEALDDAVSRVEISIPA